MTCPAYTHQHPRWTLALETRTRQLGTLNLALALAGKSCGWGTCNKPRRTFIGHHRHSRESGHHFIRLRLNKGSGFGRDAINWQLSLNDEARRYRSRRESSY
jgi:hypothetical protein